MGDPGCGMGTREDNGTRGCGDATLIQAVGLNERRVAHLLGDSATTWRRFSMCH